MGEGRAKDRRVERTRAALRQALTELILEKGYEPVIVQEIIDRANVGRSTFYAHYLDKQALLLDSLAELRAMLASQAASRREHGGLEQGRLAFSLPMFEHVGGGHAHLYRAIVGRPSGAIVQREIQGILADLARAELAAAAPRGGPQVPIEATVQFVVSALFGLLVWWIEAGLPCSAAEIDATFQRLTVPGVRAALAAPERR